MQVPTFADPRLAALLEQRREAELLQCALRGRPFDHPDVQITLLFSLPVPGLIPTEIREAAQGTESNSGRETVTKERLCAAARQLLDRGIRVIDAATLAEAAQTSVVAARKHWRHVAARLHLAMHTRRRAATMPRGGTRSIARMVLVCKGRAVPPQGQGRSTEQDDQTPVMRDHARDHTPATRLIQHRRPWSGRTRRRRVWLKGTLHKPGMRPRAGPAANETPHGPAP